MELWEVPSLSGKKTEINIMTCGNRIAEEEIHFLEENVGIWDLAFRDGCSNHD